MTVTWKQTIVSILLFLAVIWSGWLVFYGGEEDFVAPPQDRNPDGFIKDAIITQFSADGKPVLKLYSPKLTHYPNDETDIETPYFMIFQSGTDVPWEVHSVYGRSYDGMDRLELWDNVRVERAATESEAQTTILTSRMMVYPNENYAITEEPVKLIQPGTEVTATGARVSQDGKIDLFSDVRINYVPKKQDQAKEKA